MRIIKRVVLVACLLFLGFTICAPAQGAHAADVNVGVRTCDPTEGDKNLFLGFPHWYEYIHTGRQPTEDNQPTGPCNPELAETSTGPSLLNIWLIVLAILGILLRIGGIATFAMVIFGGFKYITSQGNPDATKGARQTIINAFIGMVITIIAAVSVNFGAHLLQKDSCPSGQSGTPPNCEAP